MLNTSIEALAYCNCDIIMFIAWNAEPYQACQTILVVYQCGSGIQFRKPVKIERERKERKREGEGK